MNLSLTDRVKISFIVANIVVLVTGFLMYFFLGSLANKSRASWNELQKTRELAAVVRVNLAKTTALGVRLEEKKIKKEAVKDFKEKVLELKRSLEQLKSEYSGGKLEASVQAMVEGTDTLNEYIGDSIEETDLVRLKESNFHVNLIGKISDEFSRYTEETLKRSKEIAVGVDASIASIKKNMLLVLIIAFLGTILLGWLVPHKVALPFRKINHAISELQNCNFDISIAYDEKDEIGELARELNKMISQLKKHEELRADKFVLESKKFNIIANYIDKDILVVNSEGRLTYMNNSMYSILGIESSDVIDKEIEDSLIPESIVAAFQKALKRRGKIEGEEIQFNYNVKDEEGEDKEEDFKGYAEVFPIRGKESSLDYYLMFIDDEMNA